MNLELITKEDLEAFRMSLLKDLVQLVDEKRTAHSQETLEGLKTKNVTRILGCSVNTLKSLCTTGKLRVKKIGGSNYYNKRDVQILLTEGFSRNKSIP